MILAVITPLRIKRILPCASLSVLVCSPWMHQMRNVSWETCSSVRSRQKANSTFDWLAFEPRPLPNSYGACSTSCSRSRRKRNHPTVMLLPRKSAEFIAARSKDVIVQSQRVDAASEIVFQSLKSKKYSFKVWKQHELHPKEMTKQAVDWIFVLDSLNFSFWVEDHCPPWTVRFDGKDYTGYWALCAGINRALQEGIPITMPSYYANITTEELRKIFRSETETQMPLLEERAQHLQEGGKILSQEYEDSFVNFLIKCENSAEKLLQMVTATFSHFKDEGIFADQNVSFYKRAQILIADIWACFEGQTWGLFHDISYLTMFADYKVPQALLHLGVLEYSQQLMEKLKRGDEIPPGEQLEMEIRGNSIWAVEKIFQNVKKRASQDAKSVKELGSVLNSVIIDFYLWDFAKEKVEGNTDLPCHKTRTVFY